MCDKVNTELPLFCPEPSCAFYQKTDNKITKDGVYKTKSDSTPRQRYKCHGGNHRFSETIYSDLYNSLRSFKEYEMASKMSCYGLSFEAIADVLERDIRTVEQWLNGIGKIRCIFHIFLCSFLKLNLHFWK